MSIRTQILQSVFICFFSFLIIAEFHTTSAFKNTERYTNCDACGFCITPVPASANPNDAGSIPSFKEPSIPELEAWKKCIECLYPGCKETGQSEGCSVRINTLVDIKTPGFRPNAGPTTAPNNFQTPFGCIKMGDNNIRDNTNAGGTVVGPLTTFIFGITGAITFVFIVYGSFLILTSAGDPGKLRQGQTILLRAILGGSFVLLSVFLVGMIGSGILKLPGFSETQ